MWRPRAALALLLAASLTIPQSDALVAPALSGSPRRSLLAPSSTHRGYCGVSQHLAPPRHYQIAPSASTSSGGHAVRPASTFPLSASVPAAASDAAGAEKAAPSKKSGGGGGGGGAATLKASKRLITALSFLTGWADFALISKYKTFATMMTGNTMWMASAVIDRRIGDVLYYASAIFSYIVGLVVFRRSDLALRDKSLSRVCAPLVAGAFCLADYLSYVNPTNRLIPVSLLSMAFAVINSVGSEVGGTLTFVLTGHMTKLTALGVDRVSRAAGRKRPSGGETSAAARSTLVIGAFFAGALWACGLFAKAPQLVQRGAFSMMGLLYGILFLWQDRKNMGAWWLRDDEHMCEIDDLETTCT